MNIYILIIDYNNGKIIESFVNKKELKLSLYKYVNEYWNNNDGNINNFTQEQAIDKYFDTNKITDEYYEIHKCELKGAKNEI